MIQFLRLFLITLSSIAVFASTARAAEKKKIILIAGTPSHEWGGHEHNAGVLLLAKCLKESQVADQLDVVVCNSKKDDAGKWQSGWPTDPAVFDNAAAVVIYADGGNNHPALAHLVQLDALAKAGVGIGMIHYAVEPGDEKNPNSGREYFLKWIGGYFETYRSINPHWKASFTELPSHPVAAGVKPLSTHDEWYFHMRFRDNMQGVTPILSSIPPAGLHGSDGAHNGNDEVRANKGVPETVLWVSENPDSAYPNQRGFGCTGAHVHWNWANDNFRKTILNAIVWIAHVEVPKDGVESKRPTAAELLANMDPKQHKAEQDEAWVEKKIEEINQ